MSGGGIGAGVGSLAAADSQVPTHAYARTNLQHARRNFDLQHHHPYVMFIEQEQELQDPMTSAAMDKALRVIERMVRPICARRQHSWSRMPIQVNQNRENDVYLDFKYWEDERCVCFARN